MNRYLLGSGYTKKEALRASQVWKGSYVEENFDDGSFEVWSNQDPETMIFWTYQDTLNAQANPIHKLELDTIIIQSTEQLKEVLNHIRTLDICTAWDTETTALDWQTSELVGVGICWGLNKGESAYIPVQHWNGVEITVENTIMEIKPKKKRTGKKKKKCKLFALEYIVSTVWSTIDTDIALYENVDLNEVIKLIKPFLEDATQEKCFHNAKFDMHVFANYGIHVKGIVFDTIVAHYLIKPDSYHALDLAVQEFYPCTVKKFEQVIRETKDYLKDKYKPKERPHLQKVNISHTPIEWCTDYCGVDVWSTLLLKERLEEKLSLQPEVEDLFYSIEMPLIETLFKMERKGLCLDDEWYKRTSDNLIKQRESTLKFGQEKFNINIQSSPQVRSILLNRYKLDVDIFEQTATGEVSVNADKLKELKEIYKHNRELRGFLNLVLTNRKIVKMGSTYVLGVINKRSLITQRLHTSYNQTRTETGRLSSSNPNSQNFPARGKYVKYRGGIIPEEGYLFVGADYSGCELRFLAHMSGCQAFIDTFKHGTNNGDAHATTAKLIFNLKGEPTKAQRFMGKTINFGTIYGMQYQKLARTLSISEEEAIKLFDLYWSALPEIKVFVDKSYRQAVCLGYTETILGRRRYFEFSSDKLRECRGKDWKTIDIDFERIPSNDSESLRAAANHRIQGSNADLTKKAMNTWNKTLKEEHGYLSLSIHDEIITSIRKEWVEHYTPIKKHIMETAMNLSVPLKVDLHVADNWRKLK